MATSKKTGSKKNTSTRKAASASSGKKKSTAGRQSSVNKKRKSASSVSAMREFLVLAALAFSVLLFLADFNLLGAVGPALKSVNMGIFGYMGYVMPFLLFFGICFLISNDGQAHAWLRVLGALLILCGICGFCQLFGGADYHAEWTPVDYYRESADGRGGGFLGGLFFVLLMGPLGSIGMSVVLIVIMIIGFILITEWSFTGFIREETSRVQDSRSNDSKRRQELAEARLKEREARKERNYEERILRSKQKTERLHTEAEQAREQHRANIRTEQPISHLQTPHTETQTAAVPSAASAVSQKAERPAGGNDSSSFRGNIFFGNDLYQEDEPVLIQEEAAQSERPDEQPRREQNPVSAKKKEQKQGVAPSPVTWQKAEPEFTVQIAKEPAAAVPFIEEDPESIVLDSVSPAYEEIQWADTYTEPEPIEEEPAEEFVSYEEVLTKAEPEAAEEPEYKTVVTTSGKVITVELDGVPGAKKPEPPAAAADKPEIPRPIPYVEPKEYKFPSYQLLKKGSGKTSKAALDRELRETAVKLQQTLQNFGVGVTVTNVSCGPAVTRYELQPEQGVKVSRITSLTDDIKLNLAAADIRIEAPIPGKSAIGIEVPNKENSTVSLRDLLESDDFRKHRSRLAFAVGKDIGGQNIIGDIGKMPHLLIAGATGSGKSVCINTLIMSLLYKSKPSEVKLIMIDPKVVELSVYNGIPHLMIPVVTDPKKAAGALNWAVAEMTSRYSKFAEYTVRDMAGYNRKIDGLSGVPEEEKPEKMAHIVIIVDELADLMMVAPGDVEDAICRLAQMARAAGIHLVIATQRPSVNVITGLIKANIPSRIAFAVSSGVDSRTIIDMNGAEKLLGKGDMLYYPQGLQKPIRVQGAFVSDAEVSAVVAALSSQGEVIGGKQNTQVLEATAASAGKSAAAERDELFLQAGRFIIEKDKASIGNLQRMFKIGFNRAARIMDQLAEAGVVGEEEGTKPRKILMTAEEFEAWIEDSF